MADLYFSYGSNMSSERLGDRVAITRAIGPARIDAYRLCCNKRGADGSGKANLVIDASSRAWGVLFEIAASQWQRLNGFEVGYERVSCRVTTAGGVSHDASMYLALEAAATELPPFDWYLALMLSGAREHRLPAAVIAELENWPTRRDERTRST